MENTALEKIKGTIFETALESKKFAINSFNEMGERIASQTVKNSLAGYLQAMRDCGVVTDRERMWLYLYYTQTKGGEC